MPALLDSTQPRLRAHDLIAGDRDGIMAPSHLNLEHHQVQVAQGGFRARKMEFPRARSVRHKSVRCGCEGQGSGRARRRASAHDAGAGSRCRCSPAPSMARRIIHHNGAPSTKAESPAKLKRELSEAMICARLTCAFHDLGCEIKFLPCGASISIRCKAHDAHFGARTAGPMV